MNHIMHSIHKCDICGKMRKCNAIMHSMNDDLMIDHIDDHFDRICDDCIIYINDARIIDLMQCDMKGR